MRPELTDSAAKMIEETFTLDKRAWQLLNLVVAEWESDPSSVACFDLRIVEEAKQVVKRRKLLERKAFMPKVF